MALNKSTQLDYDLKRAHELARIPLPKVTKKPKAIDPLKETPVPKEKESAVERVRLEAGVHRIVRVDRQAIRWNEMRMKGAKPKPTLQVVDPQSAKRIGYHAVEILGPSMLVYTEEMENVRVGCGSSESRMAGSCHIVTSAELICYKGAR